MNIPLVFNIPYSPELNGIELVWGIWKREYRK
jgi:transposase